MFFDSDTMRVLIATDNHLGYGEKDPIRGNDSFATFEEILQIASKEQVSLLRSMHCIDIVCQYPL